MALLGLRAPACHDMAADEDAASAHACHTRAERPLQTSMSADLLNYFITPLSQQRADEPSAMKAPNSGRVRAAKRQDEDFLSEPAFSEDNLEAGEPVPKRRASKRKKVDVNLDAIVDPALRRIEKQRAKNRRTAAASRERKKEQQNRLYHDNERLRREVESLKVALEAKENEVAQLKKAQTASPSMDASVQPHSAKWSVVESAELILSLLLNCSLHRAL